jgi:hypothetical protein
VLSLRKTSEHPNPLTILGVGPDASLDEIKSAYKARSLLLHPDKNHNPCATLAFNLVHDAYDELKDGLVLAQYRGRGDTSSLNRHSESYQHYNHTCAKMLAEIQRRQSEETNSSRLIGNRKRKVVSPLQSNSPRDSMQVDGEDQSCEDDSFECVCGEEKCTCRAPEIKRPRSADSVQSASAEITVAPRPECQFGTMIHRVFSKLYEFIDCSPATTLAPDSSSTTSPRDHTEHPPSTPTTTTDAPRCHGLGLYNFLSSSGYSAQMASHGLCKKFQSSSPCSKFNKKE